DRGGDLPPGAEARIEAAVGAVAHESEGDTAGAGGVARRDELSVRLQDERKGLVVEAADGGGDLPPGAEARIERAVGVVARERERGAAGPCGVARRDELPIGLQDERGDLVVDVAEWSDDLPARTEAPIQAAVGPVACKGEYGPASGERATRRHELPV